MITLEVRNVHDALREGLALLDTYGVVKDSRNGKVIVVEGPVTTLYKYPCERVIFWPSRDANPFFHFFESLWMLVGRKEVAFLTQFVSRMINYSDDGHTIHGAYGYRWLEHFSKFDDEKGFHGGNTIIDQLQEIIKRLKRDPLDRRSVLTMWDPSEDLGNEGKDFPCNTHAYFSRNNSNQALDMTVCCRSNDMIWGGYGANAVHFSVLQEYLAGHIRCPVGKYWQISNNYHAYVDVYEKLVDRLTNPNNPYEMKQVTPFPLFGTASDLTFWNTDLQIFFEGPKKHGPFNTSFFNGVVNPLWNAHKAYKEKNYAEALEIVADCQATDWRKACTEWLVRRQANFERAKDDGVNHENGK